jgi:hypothetical protein
MSRSGVLSEIKALNPERDHERIVFLSTCMEFPFDTTRALELALFRTFCAPRIAALLDRTGEFRERAQKRYDDTDLIVSELVEWGYSSDRGARALARMNAIHGRFKIANTDFLYVLSTFVLEPIRWNARFGWRPMCENERLALFHFWREVGHRMGIRRIPARIEGLEELNRDYECRHFRPSKASARVGRATVAMFAAWAPRPLAPFVRRAIYALLDQPCRAAFGFPTPLPVERALVVGALRLRGALAGSLPARRRPRLRTAMSHPSYPSGYTIEALGP